MNWRRYTPSGKPRQGIGLPKRAVLGTRSSTLRLLYVIGIGAGAAAFGVVALCVDQWRRGDPELSRLRDRPGVVETLRRQVGGQIAEDGEPVPSVVEGTDDSKQPASPLVVQAEALAAYLNPPVPVAVERPVPARPVPAPAVRPRSTALGLRVLATSCYAERPERSLALVDAAGGEARWVEAGTHVGHFTVHEIRQGAVVLRDGDRRHELAVAQRSRRPAPIVARTAVPRTLLPPTD